MRVLFALKKILRLDLRGVPPEAVEYLRQYGVLDVLDLAWPNLVAQKPADPLGFLLEQVSSSNSWTEVASMDIDQGCLQIYPL